MRLVILHVGSPEKLHHVLRRALGDLPEVDIVGVVAKYVPSQDIRTAERGFMACLRERVCAFGENLLHGFLRWSHAAPPHPSGEPPSEESVSAFCVRNGIEYQASAEGDDEAFVRSLAPDLGVVTGRRLPRSELRDIPRLGSIGVIETKTSATPDNGLPGHCGITLSVKAYHLSKDVVLSERFFPVESSDTPVTERLKADLVGIDCLIEATGIIGGRSAPVVPHVWRGRRGAMCPPRLKGRRTRPLFKLALRTLAYAGLWVRNRRRACRRSFPVVILFHHVITDRPHVMGMSTQQFLDQVRFLKRHYRIVSLPEALEILRRGECDVPTVVLTFDDGYAENYLCLRAVVEAEDLPVTHFICTDIVSKCGNFGHDLERGETVFPALDWDQIRQLERHGVTIGSHTRTHLDCGKGREDTLWHEIVGSRDDLRRELGHDTPYFAFPIGYPENISAKAVHVAARTFAHSFTAFGGTNSVSNGPLPLLRRCKQPQTLLELELLMQSLLEFSPTEGQPVRCELDSNEVVNSAHPLRGPKAEAVSHASAEPTRLQDPFFKSRDHVGAE